MNRSPYELRASGIAFQKFWDRDSFFVARANLSGPVSLFEDDDIKLVSHPNCQDMSGSPHKVWRRVSQSIFERSRNRYMASDRWFLALALNRLYDLDMFAVENWSRDAEKTKSKFAHVVACLPNGVYIDANGAHEGRKTLLHNYNSFRIHTEKSIPIAALSLMPVNVDWVCEIVNAETCQPNAEEALRADKLDGNSSVKRAETYAKIAFGEAIEEVLKIAAAAHRSQSPSFG
jgi:hypothetical protein